MVRLCLSPQLPPTPCSWLDSCLLQDVLNDADQKGAGFGMELVIPYRKGHQAQGLIPRAGMYLRGPRW